ncbi:hypothetical protein NQ317_009153 [Molorchus minor]|uniref:C2H2-type domain-containing protein n=1 Tax=Molorchus minor TaxID=1323400 RepID=A0ABQ9K100_9CUCU|nr:hypothetical protein NQ317_009153 [Molorchus minor]
MYVKKTLTRFILVSTAIPLNLDDIHTENEEVFANPVTPITEREIKETLEAILTQVLHYLTEEDSRVKQTIAANLVMESPRFKISPRYRTTGSISDTNLESTDYQLQVSSAPEFQVSEKPNKLITDYEKRFIKLADDRKYLFRLQCYQERLDGVFKGLTKRDVCEAKKYLETYIEYDILNITEDCSLLESLIDSECLFEKTTDIAKAMLAGILQKLSLRKHLRFLMIREGIMDYVIAFLGESYQKLPIYTTERCLALLMNLSLENEARNYYKHNSKKDLLSLLDPVICVICYNFLQQHFDFIKRVLNVEKLLENKTNETESLIVQNAKDEIQQGSESVNLGDDHSKMDHIKSEINVPDESEKNSMENVLKFAVVKMENVDEHQTYISKASEISSVIKYEDIKVEKIDVDDKLIVEEDDIAEGRKNFRPRPSECFPKAVLRTKIKRVNLSGQKMYECDICHVRIRAKCSMNRHMKIHQDPSELFFFYCYNCSFKAKSKSTLANHKQCGAEYKCVHCPFKTSRKCYLSVHMRKHIKPNVISCKHCNFRTKYMPTIRKHMRKIHGIKFASCSTQTEVT